MSFIYIIIFGMVQGLTEFLPVSSSGHLTLLSKIFNYSGNFMFLSILLHIATLLAVIIVFRKTIWQIVKNPFSSYAKKIYLSFLPTFIIVLIFNGFIEDSFISGNYLSICFMITAVLLFLCDLFAHSKHNYNKEISYKSAVVMGVMQGIAVLPGISRSGSTIAGGLFMGEKREDVAQFSFLMSIPVILASLVYDVIFHSNEIVIEKPQIFAIFTSFIVSFLVGIFAIKVMLRIVKKAKYFWFSIYLAILSFACIFV